MKNTLYDLLTWPVFMYLGTCLLFYMLFSALKLSVGDGFALATLVWMIICVIYTFRRMKARRLKTRQPIYTPVYRGPVDCNRCVHLTRNTRWLDENTCLQGTCNVTGAQITNTTYPTHCINFYSENMDD